MERDLSDAAQAPLAQLQVGTQVLCTPSDCDVTLPEAFTVSCVPGTAVVLEPVPLAPVGRKQVANFGCLLSERRIWPCEPKLVITLSRPWIERPSRALAARSRIAPDVVAGCPNWIYVSPVVFPFV